LGGEVISLSSFCSWRHIWRHVTCKLCMDQAIMQIYCLVRSTTEGRWWHFSGSFSRIHNFNIQNSQNLDFNLMNFRFHLHDFIISTSKIQLYEFNLINSRFELYQFTFWTSWSWNREVQNMNSWSSKVDFVKLKSLIHEAEIVDSGCWKREIRKFKLWIHENEIGNSWSWNVPTGLL
jgi:hypothetical protein